MAKMAMARPDWSKMLHAGLPRECRGPNSQASSVLLPSILKNWIGSRTAGT